MAKPGPKNKTEDQKAIEGTQQPCRKVVPLVPQIDGAVHLPKLINDRPYLLEIWNRKVATFIKRGQPIVGCEDVLALYVYAIDKMNRIMASGEMPSVNEMNALRHLSNEFLDTPASQYGKMASKPVKENPFLKNRPTAGGK